MTTLEVLELLTALEQTNRRLQIGIIGVFFGMLLLAALMLLSGL